MSCRKGFDDPQREILQRTGAAWQQSLKLPVGIMACDVPRAHHVLKACHRLGLQVPENVAILGLDNNELTGDMKKRLVEAVLD